MNTKTLILQLARRRQYIRSGDILKQKKISRQTLAQHFRELIDQGKLIKIGSTRGAKYTLLEKGKTRGLSSPWFRAFFKTDHLKEDRVFGQISLKLRLKKFLSNKVFEIVNYAFTEMLNNAIEHSGAASVRIEFLCDGKNARFTVLDKGIGAFENLRRKFRFKDHMEACELMLKGKQTTDPKHHSGQGIFFTSKIADQFVLESGHLRLKVDNDHSDIFLEDIKKIKGTAVSFRIGQKTKKNLKALFDAYSDTEYAFDKTQVTIRLLKKEAEYVSRSEAKRLLFGLDKFKRVILDFKGVPGIGQGFADEIFRVFQNRCPHIALEPKNMSKSVAYMVRRAKVKTLQ